MYIKWKLFLYIIKYLYSYLNSLRRIFLCDMLRQICCCLVAQAALFWCYALAVDDLPPEFPRCHRNDPQIEKCLLEASETVRPYLRSGVPGLLPSVQNYTLNGIVMQDGNDALSYKMEMPETVSYGLEDYQMKRISFDPKTLTFSMEYILPELVMQGKYNLEGKIFFAPLKGHGTFSVHLTNTRVSLVLNLKVVKKNGIEYLRPIRSIPSVEAGEVKDYDFEGLFAENGSNNNEVDRVVKRVIDDNLVFIVKEIRPNIENGLTVFFNNLLKSIFHVPYDKLFPK